MKRCIQTAQEIATATSASLRVSQQLAERDLGPFDGLSKDQLLRQRVALGRPILDPTQDWFGFEDVESDASVNDRAGSLVKQCFRNYDEGIAVLVTHAGVIKSLLHIGLNIPRDRVNCFKIRNCAIVVLKSLESGIEIQDFLGHPSTYQ